MADNCNDGEIAAAMMCEGNPFSKAHELMRLVEKYGKRMGGWIYRRKRGRME